MSDLDFTENKKPSRPPNCMKCAYFKVEWNFEARAYLRTCEIFSVGSVNMPSYEVYRATGANCPSFKLKEGLKS